jgi:hypothetical protein
MAFVYGSVGSMTAVGFGIGIFGQRPDFPSWLILAIAWLYIPFAVYGQQWSPYQVAVTPEALRLTWTLGIRNIPWDQVAVIELLPHVRKPAHIALAVVRLKHGRKYDLQDQLTNFDDLVDRLRTLHPELIRAK